MVITNAMEKVLLDFTWAISKISQGIGEVKQSLYIFTTMIIVPVKAIFHADMNITARVRMTIVFNDDSEVMPGIVQNSHHQKFILICRNRIEWT